MSKGFRHCKYLLICSVSNNVILYSRSEFSIWLSLEVTPEFGAVVISFNLSLEILPARPSGQVELWATIKTMSSLPVARPNLYTALSLSRLARVGPLIVLFRRSGDSLYLYKSDEFFSPLTSSCHSHLNVLCSPCPHSSCLIQFCLLHILSFR
jgi:hypothetical protein